MLAQVNHAIIAEILVFLKENQTFFEDKSGKDALEKLTLPKPVKEYLLQADADQFVAEFSELVRFITGSVRKQELGSLMENQLLKAIVKFWSFDVMDHLDVLTTDFYLKSKKDQLNQLADLVLGEGMVSDALRDLIATASAQELAKHVREFVGQVLASPLIVVQTPREVAYEFKKEIREQLRAEYGDGSLPVFQINRNLIGGMRVFVDSEVKDFSWLGRIKLITSLKS